MAIDLTDLVSVWELAEASGDALDSYGSNTLTETGGAIGVGSAPANLAGSRDFEEADSRYFLIADNASLSVADIDFTIGAWVNAETFGATRGIIGKWNTGSSEREYALIYAVTANRFRFDISTNGVNAVNREASTLGAPSTGSWYFILAWHDSVANTVNICVNDGTVDSSSHSTGVRDGASNLNIGALNGTSSRWDGLIAQAFFFKRVLTSGERTELYNSGGGLPFTSWASTAVYPIAPCAVLLPSFPAFPIPY